MIRKTTAIIFILLANIVLLVHVVFPHHHHDQQVCLNLTCCCPTATHSSAHPADCMHGHGSDGPDINCILKQLVIVPDGKGRVEPVVLSLENSTDCFILQTGYSGELMTTDLFCGNSYSKNIPLPQTDSDSVQGLRAPPAV